MSKAADQHDQQVGKCLVHPTERARGCRECAKLRAYPVSLCPRCKQPMMAPRDGTCATCHKMQSAQKNRDYDKRCRELIKKNRDVIDFTGYEDIREAIADA